MCMTVLKDILRLHSSTSVQQKQTPRAESLRASTSMTPTLTLGTQPWTLNGRDQLTRQVRRPLMPTLVVKLQWNPRRRITYLRPTLCFFFFLPENFPFVLQWTWTPSQRTSSLSNTLFFWNLFFSSCWVRRVPRPIRLLAGQKRWFMFRSNFHVN